MIHTHIYVPPTIPTDQPVVVKSPSDKNSTSTSMVDSDLVQTVLPGTYYFYAECMYNVPALSGVKQSLSGTAVMNSINATSTLYNISAGAIGASISVNALNILLGAVSIGTEVKGVIEGVMDVATAGTVFVRFAQNAGLGGTTTMLGLASFSLTKII